MRVPSLAAAVATIAILAACQREVEHEEGQAAALVTTTKDAKIDALVAELDTSRMKTELTDLVNLGTRNATSAGFTQALVYCESALAKMGYTTTRQTVRVSGKDTSNLVWEKKGTGSDVVLLTAHLDSINQSSSSATSAAPGADDNGTGSVGTLEVARILANEATKATVRFVLFTGEEEGLYGSKKYVSSLAAADKKAIKAVVNMDMIGTINGGVARGVLLEGATVSQSVIDGLASAAATYTTLTVKTSLRPYNSDHVPFINAGLPAVLTIEANDGANGNMHTKNDTLDKVDFELMRSILAMNLAYLARAAGVSAAPSGNTQTTTDAGVRDAATNGVTAPTDGTGTDTPTDGTGTDTPTDG